MKHDNSNKVSKREQVKRTNKNAENDRKKKHNEDSDSDNSTFIESDNEEIDMHEFRKYVQKIFPSKNMKKKIEAGERVKKFIKNKNNNRDNYTSKKKSKKETSDSESSDDAWETESNESEKESIKRNKNRKKRNKTVNVSDEETLVSESQCSSDYDIEDEETETNAGKPGKLNIIFTIGGAAEDDEEWDEFDEDYDEDDDEDYSESEDEDKSVSTNEYSEDEYFEESDYEDETSVKKKNKNKNKKEQNQKTNLNKNDVKNEIKTSKNITRSSNKEDKIEVLEQLKELLSKNPNDKSIEKCIKVYEEEINNEIKKKEKKEKKQKEKNMRIFKKILSDKNSMNDFTFYQKLDIENQKKLIKELREINKITRIEKPYRMTLLESNIPVEFKAAAFKKVNTLRYMEPGSGEFYKIKNWVDAFMKIPFTTYKSLPISIDDGVENCHNFMETAQKTLDDAVYGLSDAKMQIMQMLGQLLTNPKSIGTAIAIHGPPGTGKTSLVKEGISKILNRPFTFIPLGGATDSSFLEGHSYTYEGSNWGKIVQILIDSKCMNPVIYFDELDKISDTPRGEEIAGILTHLTDTSQNSEFHDKYFAEINFDLSKCLFIFSYNDESKVNHILKDRMYRIKTKGYSSKEKTAIANNYLLPKIREQVKFNNDDIIISDDVLSYINDVYCNKEDGVRNMKRCLEIIHTKLNLYRLMKPGANLFEEDLCLKVEFPFNVTKDVVDKLIKKDDDNMNRYIRDTLYV